MRKNIDVDESIIKKIKLISAYENKSVKAILEEAVTQYVRTKELERFEQLTEEEKEDLGLLLLMQQNDHDDEVSEEEIFKLLDE
ncbi:hypothetical protein HC174_04800 [Salinimicrobium sp. CDJ15-81-2]|nr:hypothetical protein [Salinimicrobium nanhaiense]